MVKVGKYKGWTWFNVNTTQNPLYWAMKDKKLKTHTNMYTSLTSLKEEIRKAERKVKANR